MYCATLWGEEEERRRRAVSMRILRLTENDNFVTKAGCGQKPSLSLSPALSPSLPLSPPLSLLSLPPLSPLSLPPLSPSSLPLLSLGGR